MILTLQTREINEYEWKFVCIKRNDMHIRSIIMATYDNQVKLLGITADSKVLVKRRAARDVMKTRKAR